MTVVASLGTGLRQLILGSIIYNSIIRVVIKVNDYKSKCAINYGVML